MAHKDIVCLMIIFLHTSHLFDLHIRISFREYSLNCQLFLTGFHSPLVDSKFYTFGDNIFFMMEYQNSQLPISIIV